MADVVLYTAAGAQVPACALGMVGEVTWSTGWGNGRAGGCQDASWSMGLNPDYTDPLFTPGRRVEVYDGPARVWSGVMMEPERGSDDEPWQLHARGLASRAQDYFALDSTGAPTSVPSTAVQQAITRGLPWNSTSSNGLSSSAFSASSTTTALNKVSDLLDAYAASLGQTWAVFDDGELTLSAAPTVPTWLARGGGETAMATADDEWVTRVVARYVSAVTGTPPVPSAYSSAAAEDADARDRWGGREAVLDLTKLGLMSGARATSLATAALTEAGVRTGFTSPFTVTRDTLMTLGGAPARLEQVRAGDMVRLLSTLDPSGQFGGAYADVVISEVQVTDGADEITCKPLGFAPRDLASILAAPEPPQIGEALTAFTEVA